MTSVTILAKALLRVAELREASWLPDKGYVDDRRLDPQIAGRYTKTEEVCRAEAWAESGLTTPWLGLIELLFSINIRVASLEWAKMTLAADSISTGGKTIDFRQMLMDLFRTATPEKIAEKLEVELARRRESGEDDPETGVMYKGVSFR